MQVLGNPCWEENKGRGSVSSSKAWGNPGGLERTRARLPLPKAGTVFCGTKALLFKTAQGKQVCEEQRLQPVRAQHVSWLSSPAQKVVISCCL